MKTFGLVWLFGWIAFLGIGVQAIAYDETPATQEAAFLTVAVLANALAIGTGGVLGLLLSRRQSATVDAGRQTKLPPWAITVISLGSLAGIILTGRLHESVAYIMLLGIAMVFMWTLMMTLVVVRARRKRL